MAIKTSTLRPGLLVSLKTSITGNVSYKKIDLEEDHETGDGARLARWETERTITDAADYEKARKVRGKAGSLIRGVCANSAFGLLCPESAAEQLEAAIKAARAMANEFNEESSLSRLSVNVLIGRIAPDDVEAVKAINSELRDLLADMETGLRNLNVKAIREAAGKAKQLGSMLSPDAAARVQIAVEAARSSARKIVAAGEEAAAEIDLRAVRAVTEARTAFLDLDEVREIGPAIVDHRSLDLAPIGV